MTAPQQPDVDELRQRLKALGYLDAGVDRFVLAPARSGRTRVALALGASVRIGALAGLLMGLSGTLAMALRVPGFVGSVREGIVVALVLVVAFGLATALATFLVFGFASHAVRWLGARVSLHARMRPMALAAGFVVGSACLAYLTLWWNVANAAAGLSVTTIVALVVAVAISVMLGHVTTTTALALMAYELDDHLPTAPRVASTRTSAALALVGVLAATVVVFAITRAGDQAVEAPALTVVPTGQRVVVIGVDGFDAAFARTLVADGGMPMLARILAAPHVEVSRGDGVDPVPLWASIATGQPPGRHGALGLEARRVAGIERLLPVSSSRLAQAVSAATDMLRLTRPTISSGIERRSPAFWEVAARAGLRTLVVNWWTTWPARAEDGIVVSDRAVLRLERGGNAEGEIVPADVYTSLQASWPSTKRAAAERAARLVEGVAPGTGREAAQHAIELDGTLAAFVAAVPAAQLDLLTIYLPGLDIAQVNLFKTREAMTPADLAVALRGVTAVYASIDDIVSRLSSAGATIVFVGHPGRGVTAQSAWLAVVAPQNAVTASGPGTTSASGPANDAAPALEDVAPTVLALLGVPLAHDIAGHARLDLIIDGLNVPAPRTVSTWGTRTAIAPGASRQQLDDEARERLRSLGYVR